MRAQSIASAFLLLGEGVIVNERQQSVLTFRAIFKKMEKIKQYDPPDYKRIRQVIERLVTEPDDHFSVARLYSETVAKHP